MSNNQTTNPTAPSPPTNPELDRALETLMCSRFVEGPPVASTGVTKDMLDAYNQVWLEACDIDASNVDTVRMAALQAALDARPPLAEPTIDARDLELWARVRRAIASEEIPGTEQWNYKRLLVIFDAATTALAKPAQAALRAVLTSSPAPAAEVGEPTPEKMSGLFRIALGALASIAADEDTNVEAKTYAADVTRSLTEAAKKLSTVKEAGHGA